MSGNSRLLLSRLTDLITRDQVHNAFFFHEQINHTFCCASISCLLLMAEELGFSQPLHELTGYSTLVRKLNVVQRSLEDHRVIIE